MPEQNRLTMWRAKSEIIVVWSLSEGISHMPFNIAWLIKIHQKHLVIVLHSVQRISLDETSDFIICCTEIVSNDFA